MERHLPVIEELKQLNQDLLNAQADQTLLSHLGRQCAEMDACLLQSQIAHIGLQAILTLLQRRDEPLLFSSDEAVALLEPVQQRLSHGLSCLERLV
ncbi:hypothetical protein [Chromobacterium haemolyticum]|uniref:hypothetical protein n=1 Tax=Chromobacterium haemolyticum TaxID=394935 RepID=UPI0002EDB241|nr:hypothetical protein [Chromobacterium haemolyticum]